MKGKAQCETVWGHTLYHPEDVPYKLDMSDLPDTFTPARHKVRAAATHSVSCCVVMLCMVRYRGQTMYSHISLVLAVWSPYMLQSASLTQHACIATCVCVCVCLVSVAH